MEKTYAYIKNNEVVNLGVFDNPSEEILLFFKNEYSLDEIVLSNEKTIIGGTYDGNKFWYPQPYPSWVKNEELNEWESLVSYPEIEEDNPKSYTWDESKLSWEEVAS